MTERLELMDIVVTDYGNVRLSSKTIAWLRSIDPEWREIAHNKRRRGKHARYVREQVQRVECAVMIAAAIAWAANDDLKEF